MVLQGGDMRRNLYKYFLFPGYRLALQLTLNIKLRIINGVQMRWILMSLNSVYSKSLQEATKNFASNLL